MRVYVCTCLERKTDAVLLAAQLRALGHTVVSDWHDIVPAAHARADESRLADAARLEIAAHNLGRLQIADRVVFLADERCRGSYVEIGFAFAHCIPVLAVGEERRTTVMAAPATWLPDPRTLLEALS